MELRYVLLTIVKILISVPTVVLYQSLLTDGAGLMGGHLDNKNVSANSTDQLTTPSSQEIAITNNTESKAGQNSEEIPDPSPLVLPGYNLPENIFNKGKPFYLEKDPLTGKIDFDSKTATLRLDDDLYDYVDEEPSSDIYDKSNIDRKDGSLGSHRPSDINQLTPNFHDFLNLPVKYNSDKYVYPLISSSYANTKIQGNINKYHNHKDYSVKTSTVKPTGSPTYYKSPNYYSSPKTTETTTTTTTTTTPKTTTEVYLTSTSKNLMNSEINHPSFHEDFEDYYEETERPNQIYLTTKNVNNIYLTTKAPSTTTRRVLSVFEQLFGEYDEIVPTTEKPKPPKEIKTDKPLQSAPSDLHYPNSHAGPNVLTGSSMGLESASYEYEDYEEKINHEDNVAMENKPVKEVQNDITSSTTAPTTTTSTTQSTTTSTTTQPSTTKRQVYDEYDYEERENDTKKEVRPTQPPTSTMKVTSLPLGENHITNLNNHQSIIVATQNLREQLNNEKVVPKPFGYEKQQPPSTSNIHIAPDQDMVSFVVGNHQNVEGNQYVGTSLKESPYDSNPFRPLYGQQPQYSKGTVSYTVQASPAQNYPPAASSVTIQPQKNSEASLAIGVPINSLKQVPGQVVDEKLEIGDEKIEYPKGTGGKIVFPDDKQQVGNLIPPLQPPPIREVLQLNSKPMYHQLPSDLTPPKEKDVVPNASSRIDRPRPPWDPRPGHFYSGKPEYVRPPRPPPEIAYKRIDNLPNILPQFRPNMKSNVPPHYLNRQPLLERPSNRPIGFFEKLQPPPPPKNLHNLRKIPPPPPPPNQIRPVAEDRIINEAPKKLLPDQFFYQSPPKVVLGTRRIANLDGDVETLQMIQAKKGEKKEIQPEVVTEKSNSGTDKPLYVVYPVNTPPIKLDVIDSNTKESVVIGTRAELPLPPSKINQSFDYEQNPILNPKDRNDAPILKPHPRPTFPIKSDFPYPLERPDPSVLNPAVPEVPSKNGNNLDEADNFVVSGNQWNTIGENIESRIVNGHKVSSSNQISVTLKTYTEKPIAVAYTPTEPHRHDDKYSMPNYGSPVIPEIRLGTVSSAHLGHGNPDNEFTVSAVMHTHPQVELKEKYDEPPNHKSDTENLPNIQQDFQAPFQASVNIDSMSQGWSVVRDKNKSTTEIGEEVTTLPLATTSEFDIENFKPQLIGGFKPIYNFPDEAEKTKEAEVSERAE
ncbi:uncharacterized protein LOC123015181 [Tribolium madens]|uniref:uncharacterized protein LOC123015181 n=1 Tax=Tribolium madens TaxID=41895 RepID=UPI001CF736B4|nr:uncharacterized protein LOC123015181 [Tribolium madens]